MIVNEDEAVVNDYLNMIGRYDKLSEDELRELVVKANEGDTKARDKAVACNLRLVVTISSKYINKGLPFMDLIQEGNLGLLKAIEKFDVSKSNKFCTYAGHWILRYIYRALGDYVSAIRLPRYMCEFIRKYKDCIHNLTLKYNREPTDDEVMSDMGITPLQLHNIKEAYTVDMTVSSNMNLSEDMQLEDTFIDEDADIPFIVGLQTFMIEDLQRLISRLSRKEQDLIINHYGLFGTNPKPLRVVASIMNMNEKYLGRLERQAIQKLLEMQEFKCLKEYLE